MTARATQRKRPTARERLLDFVDNYGGACEDQWGQVKFRRLLRAHERELAERAVKAATSAHEAAVRDAILNPSHRRVSQ